MHCIEPGLLQEYLDKETSPKETARIENHLAACPACADRLAGLQRRSERIRKTLDLLAAEEISVPGFIPPAETRTLPLPSRRKRLILGLSAACVLIFLVTTVLFIRKPRSPQPVFIVNSLDREIDANRTVTQQPMVITIIDENGNVTGYPVR